MHSFEEVSPWSITRDPQAGSGPQAGSPVRPPMKLAALILMLFFSLVRPAPAQEDYVLGPEDEIEIKVWDHEDLTRKQRVGLEGKISFPFVGDLKAQGLTVLQLQKELERRLGQGYIVDPHVSINIIEYKSQKFFVVGDVQRPGTYPLTKNIRVVEAISMAGGLAAGGGSKPVASGTAIIVRARPGEKPDQPRLPDQVSPKDKITVSLSAALAGNPKDDVEIRNSDTIYVPTLVYYVSGQVKSPGRYPYEEGMTVLQAVTTAGGFTDKAAPGRTHVIRGEGPSKEKVKIGQDDRIKAGDTIVVPESWF